MSIATLAALALLVAALLFGGTSEQGAASGFAFELISLGILCALSLFGARQRLRTQLPGVTLLAAAVGLVYALQLVPLPPALWTSFGGRTLILEGYRLLHLVPGWRPLSVNPKETIASALALLPAVAAVSLALRLPRTSMTAWGGALIALSCLSVIVGIAQLIGGEASPLQFYYADSTRAAGFFANPNHLATLLLATLPFLAALLSRLPPAIVSVNLAWVVAGAVMLLLALGILITGSQAGVLLFIPTLAASIAIVLRAHPRRFTRRAKGVTIAGLVMLGVAVPLALMALSGRTMRHTAMFEQSPLARTGLAKTTFQGALDTWPVGSGLGTFVSVYPTHEQLTEVSQVFVNHAHNEYLEILFEAGLLGAAVIMGVLLWWGRRSYQAWRSQDDDAPWRQAAAISIGIVMAHSLVDYPARTPAILVILGTCAAMLDRRWHPPLAGAVTNRGARRPDAAEAPRHVNII